MADSSQHSQSAVAKPLAKALGGGRPHVLVNGDMGPDEVQRFCELDDAGRQLLRNAAAQMNLSARAYHLVLKLAGSPVGAIADLAGEESIRPLDLAEALQYRPWVKCRSIVQHFSQVCLPAGLKFLH